MKADICFILEGTYPYVAGGVSTWVDQTIKANPHLHFSILHLAANEESSKVLKYDVPHNVSKLNVAYLHETKLGSKGKPYNDKHTWETIRNFYSNLPNAEFADFESMINAIFRDDGLVNSKSLLFSKKTWKLLIDLYGDKEISLIDYFWTWRFTHLPLLSLLNADIPSASVYHSVSTGYAGLLACIAKIKNGGRMFLSEHGIYAKERKIEISQSNWVYDERKEDYRASTNMGFFRQWWIEMFMVMSKIAYQCADEVTTLFSGNYSMQLQHGCPAEKLTIIPNGIDTNGYRSVKEKRYKFREENPNAPFTIGFVGRVTPIKDVKTFIRAIKMVLEHTKHIKVFIMGPLEEDEDYVDECKILIDMFDLNDIMIFTGRVNVKEYYPQLDVVLLTSVSEGLPFVILEAHAASIPCISTDVGACKELIYGLTAEDKALGPSGEITQVASPGQTASAIIRMIEDKNYYNAACTTSVARVEMFYRIENINAKYTHMYHSLMKR